MAMGDASGIGRNRTSTTNRGVGLEGSGKGNTARRMVHSKRLVKEYSTLGSLRRGMGN